MAEVRKRGARVHLHLDRDERAALLLILDELSGEFGKHRRTMAVAYDDPELQAEYQRFVAPEVEHNRNQDVVVVRDCLTAEEDVTTLTEAQAMAWVRALNHLRLAAGGLAGIESTDWEKELIKAPQPAVRALLALGYLQEEMVAALDG